MFSNEIGSLSTAVTGHEKEGCTGEYLEGIIDIYCKSEIWQIFNSQGKPKPQTLMEIRPCKPSWCTIKIFMRRDMDPLFSENNFCLLICLMIIIYYYYFLLLLLLLLGTDHYFSPGGIVISRRKEIFFYRRLSACKIFSSTRCADNFF